MEKECGCGQEPLEYSKQSVKHTCDPCQTVYDKNNVQGAGFCVQCVEYLCQSCLNHHQKLKATRTHDLLIGHEIPDSKAPFQMLEVIGKCPTHSEVEVAYECKEHEQFLCIHCVKADHMHCSKLIEVALNVSNEINKTKLLETLSKIEENAEKCEALLEKKKRNLEVMIKKRDEILARQRTLKLKLEKALKDLQRQEDQVSESFGSRLSKLSSDMEKLAKLQDRNQLFKHFAQATSKYAQPSQLYIVANGHFQHIDDELVSLADKKEGSSSSGDITDIKDDVLNLFLAVEVSKEIYENGSDSCTDDQAEEIVEPAWNSLAPACPERELEGNKKVFQEPKKSLMDCEVTMSDSHCVRCVGDTKPCDIVGVAMVTSDFLHVVIDYGNTKVKVFDHSFRFLSQKHLEARPCSVCRLNHKQIAVLLVEKIITIFDVSKHEVKQVKIIRLDMFGHSITKYGNNLAVMCSDSKFDGKFESTCPLISIKIIDPVNSNTVSSLTNFFNRAPNHGKEIKLVTPCQIYSRYGKELIIGTDIGLKAFDKDGVQKWFFSREHDLKRTTGITSDTDNNLYLCGYGSNNIHQVFSYTYTKIIIEEVQNPWAIAYDQRGKKLVVGCRKRNSIIVYKLI